MIDVMSFIIALFAATEVTTIAHRGADINVRPGIITLHSYRSIKDEMT